MNASTNPTARPNRMPSGTEFTLRAKMPAATPAIKPLIVEPKMIPTNCARTAGVNQADPPSIAPSTAPTRSPRSTLFMANPPIEFPLLLSFYTTNFGFPLRLSVQKKQNQYAHRQVRCNQQDKEAVTAVKASGLFQNSLPVRADSEPVQIARNVQSHFLNVGVTVCWRRCGRLSANCHQRFIEAGCSRRGDAFQVAGEYESQQRSERIDVAAGVQKFLVAASSMRIAGTQNFCETPVHYQDFAERADHNVGRF